MKIIAVDDEELAVDHMKSLLKQVQPDAEFLGFTEPEEAFHYLSNNMVDIAFLDIEMGEYTGIELAKKCKDLCPRINIIFVTGYSQYTMDALKLRVSGYLMKPVRLKDLYEEIENLRTPVIPAVAKRVLVQTFGNFEIFYDGKPLKLPTAKSREAIAYLIDRKGARVTFPELATILWEDRPYDRVLQNNIHRTISDLLKCLRSLGIADIVIKTHKDIAIDPDKISCDYYGAISGDMRQMNAFAGEYMSNYSWAEFTLGTLCRRMENKYNF